MAARDVQALRERALAALSEAVRAAGVASDEESTVWVSRAQPLDPAWAERLLALADGLEGVADVRELVARMRTDGAGVGGW
jgi:hypothetical protein